jgi:hypothetical protein
MSARFFNIFLIVLFAHMVILSVLWVGFPVPPARGAAAFVYEGAWPAFQDNGSAVSDAGQNPKASNPVYFDSFEASYFNHWIELRNPSKS